MLDIVIIGAGAAGIGAARTLQARGIAFQLLEASPRVGGRAFTDNATFGVPIDLGCHWFHSPGHNPLVAFADRFGHRYLRGPQDNRYATEVAPFSAAQSSACGDYIHVAFDRIRQFAAKNGDVPLHTLFDTHEPFYRLLEASLVAKMGVNLGDISLTDFAGYFWEGEDLPVLDGLGNLIAKLADGIPVTLGTPAQKVAWHGKNGIRVETPVGTLDARAAIVTVSTGVLASRTIRFDPALPDCKAEAIADLPMGSCNKVILGFDRNVFGDCRTTLLLPDAGPEAAVEFLLRPDGQEIAVCLFNGPISRALAKAGPAAMRDHALAQLAAIFGSAVGDRVVPTECVADWDGEPWIRGCFAAARPGRAAAREALGRPVADRLFFAGEATSRDYAGDAHGAFLTGIAAAEAAVAAIRAP